MKRVNGVLVMLFWWLIEKLLLPYFTLFISQVAKLVLIEIPDDTQINVAFYGYSLELF